MHHHPGPSFTLIAQGFLSSRSRWCQAGRAKSSLFDFQLWNFAVILWVAPLNNCPAYRLLGRWEWFRVYGEDYSLMIKMGLLRRPGGHWQAVFSSPILIFLILILTSFFKNRFALRFCTSTKTIWKLAGRRMEMIFWLRKIVHGFFLKAVLSNSGLRMSYSLHMNKFAQFEKNLMFFSHYIVSDFLPPCHQAPLSMGLSRQESWSGLPFLSPGHFLDPGIEPRSPSLAGRFLTTEPPGKP